MEQIKVSKNYKLSGEITDIRELLQLAKERKPVAYKEGLQQRWAIKPAAIVVNWSLMMLSLRTFYKIEKL